MTVKELIAKLQALPQEQQDVAVHIYSDIEEGGGKVIDVVHHVRADYVEPAGLSDDESEEWYHNAKGFYHGGDNVFSYTPELQDLIIIKGY